jgi:hypothetical protein
MMKRIRRLIGQLGLWADNWYSQLERSVRWHKNS